MVDTAAAAYTPSGYIMTATDILEWNYFWSETVSKWQLSWFDYLVSQGGANVLFGGIDCQATPVSYIR